MWPASWNSRSLPRTTVWPRWMSGAVGSIPSFTRSGRPASSCSASAPSGSTSTALRIRRPASSPASRRSRWVVHPVPGCGESIIGPMLDCRPRLGGRPFPCPWRVREPPICGSPARRRAVRTVNRWPHHDAKSRAPRAKPTPGAAPTTTPSLTRAPGEPFADTAEIEFDFSGDPEFIPGRPLSPETETADGNGAGSTPAVPRRDPDRQAGRARAPGRGPSRALRGERRRERQAARRGHPPAPSSPIASLQEARPAAAEEAAHSLRARRPRAARPCLDGLRDDGRGLPGPAGDLRLRQVQVGEEQRRLRRQRREDRHPDQQQQQDPAGRRADLNQRQERGGLDRRLPLLRAQRRRLPGDRPRPRPGRPLPVGPAGRLDDHRAVREERAGRAEQPHDPGEVPRGGARLPAGAPLDQGQDPHRVPEHGLFRRGGLRDRGGGEDLLRLLPSGLRHDRRALRLGALPVGGGDAGRDHRLALGLRPEDQPADRPRPAQFGAREDEGTGLHHRGRLPDGDPPGAALARGHPAAHPRLEGALLHLLAAPAAGRQVRADQGLLRRAEDQVDPRPRPPERRPGSRQQLPRRDRADRGGGRDQQRERRRQGDGRRARTTRRRPSTSPPRATGSPGHRSSRSSSPRPCARGSPPTPSTRRRPSSSASARTTSEYFPVSNYGDSYLGSADIVTATSTPTTRCTRRSASRTSSPAATLPRRTGSGVVPTRSPGRSTSSGSATTSRPTRRWCSAGSIPG